MDLETDAGRAVHGTVAPLVRPAGPQDSSYIRWVWTCPSCGHRTVSLHSQNESKAEIESDPLCYRCRKPNTPHGAAKPTSPAAVATAGIAEGG